MVEQGVGDVWYGWIGDLYDVYVCSFWGCGDGGDGVDGCGIIYVVLFLVVCCGVWWL